MSDLPAYTIRISPRAKRALLKILPPGRVEVVVPKRFNRRQIPAFVAEHRVWISRQLQDMQSHYATELVIPDVIDLSAIGERWSVEYQENSRIRVSESDQNCLRLAAPNAAEARAILRVWLHDRARQVLPPRLLEVSEALGLPFNRVVIRAQRTRWGSCSSKNNINLNRAMLFLSPLEMRYLMIHELCHTIHLNHSSRYWSLVTQMMPDYKRVDRGLRQAMHRVPGWALENH